MSSKKPSVVRNFLYNSGYEILMLVLPFITAPYITRILTADSLGRYTYVHTIVNYFVLFAALGVSLSGNRAIARVKDNKEECNKVFSATYIAQFFVSMAVILAYLFWWGISGDGLYFPLLMFLVGSCFNVVWAMQGLEQFKTTTLICASLKVISVLSIFIFVKDKDDLILYAWINGLAIAIQNIIIFCLTKKYIKFVRVTAKQVFIQFKPMLLFFIPVISVSIYKTMDKVMIGAFTDDMAGVSNYYYAEQILGIPQGIVLGLCGVLRPRITNLQGKDNSSKEENLLIGNTITASIFLSCALSFGIAGVSSVFIPLYLDEAYINCGKYILLLFPTSIMISWTAMMRSLFLIPRNQDKNYFLSVIVGAVANFIINATLLTKIGIEGAIIGTLVAELLTMLIQTIAVFKIQNITKYITNVLPFLLIGAVMFIICRGIGNVMPVSWLTLILQVVVGAIVYICLSFIYLKIKPTIIHISKKKE